MQLWPEVLIAAHNSNAACLEAPVISMHIPSSSVSPKDTTELTEIYVRFQMLLEIIVQPYSLHKHPSIV